MNTKPRHPQTKLKQKLSTLNKALKDHAVHMCDTCANEFPTCNAKRIVWAIQRDPSLRGVEADKVRECDAYALKAGGAAS